MELFRVKHFLQNLKEARKYLCRSLFFRIETCNFSKERTATHVFSDEFWEIVKTRVFYRTPPGDCFCSLEKYFTNKIEKKPSEKRNKKLKQLVRKTTTHAKQKLNHYLYQVFISFTVQKFFYFSFLCFS